MIVLLIVILLIGLCYLFALRGRTRHRLLRRLRKWKYAHRGLHNAEIPENSLKAFAEAIENGYGFELDVHLLADGELAVFHDRSLKRMCGEDVQIESLTYEQLTQYRLNDTDETIPTFRQVLDLCNGRVPMIVELKPFNGNHAELSEKTCEALADYSGLFCMESFDPRCVRWFKDHHPQIVRGQLAHNSMKEGKGKVPFFLRVAMTNLLSNIWNQPDFIAYRFKDRVRPSVILARKLWKMQGVSWTLRNVEDYETAVNEGWIPIFEGFKP